MKKAIKTLIVLLIVPAIAGLGVWALWNSVVTSVFGLGAISYLQGVGLFVLGQLLSCGFIFVMFFCLWSLHIFCHHGDWADRWHNMSDQERLEFIRRRRMEHSGFHNRAQSDSDVAE